MTVLDQPVGVLNAAGPQPSETPVKTRVALVNMPFAMADRPSIQCGLLKGCLTRLGHEVDVFYLNLELAAELGAALYQEVSQLRTDQLLGEWLFSAAAFGHRPNEEEYRQACPSLAGTCERTGLTFERLCELRNEVLPAWVAGWAEKVDWSRYSAVGFTSTFEQNTAAFALARRIKEAHPEVALVFGGANFDGTMGREYVRALPFIDYAVIGEGDEALPRLIARIAQGESGLGLPGVVGRSEGRLVEGESSPRVRNMDDLPDPDYDEYFATLFRLGRGNVLGRKPPLLLFETSRGCWWGEKQHCTFCGLNNNGMQFRAKSPAEAVDQLGRLASKYKIVNFEAVDNIMDYRYLEQLCGPLAERRYDYRLFYEVKANLSPAQLRNMARAGIKVIQPGIESLNSHVLALMRKGITMLRNVRLLKWAYYYGMSVGWNLLTGFPGETAEDYEEQLKVVRLLRHLPPPRGTGRIWLERFSPYFFDPSFPVRNVRPLDVYRFIYPQEELDFGEIAYFFQYEMEATLPEGFHAELHRAVEDWRDAWGRKPRPELVYQRAEDWIQVVDNRSGEVAAHALQGQDALIYELCGETDQTVDGLRKQIREQGGTDPGAEEVRGALRRFCDLGLMLEEKDRYLSLALPVNPNW
ncbi:MAG TPA: RiPP maturation radical SAM C-methyltransferase [Thermoanaerobaculia bacterium]|nr:RiPP maturation radical SAM C-methyltransferase [Thermoanaerobaculia bacterium]